MDSEIDKGCSECDRFEIPCMGICADGHMCLLAFRFFVKVKAAMHFQAEQERIMDAPVAPTPSKPPMPLARSRVLVVEGESGAHWVLRL